jgi:thiamine-monophosphate kinase
MHDKSFFQSEADFITWIRRRAPERTTGLTLGIGDDAALVAIPARHEVILTTDMSIEDVHFDSALHSPQAIGHRALARSLSDIAAMGGTPRYALISLALSGRTKQIWLKRVYSGLFALARKFGVAVIGGDTAVTSGPTLIDVIMAGEVPKGQALRRSGAKAGDQIYVSGRLGMSALGLRLLQSGAQTRTTLERAALRAHLFPQPQCALGRFLSAKRLASGMMDLSDGLSIDLRRLSDASGVGATLFATRLPVPALPDQNDALNLALHGGEDYQLLFIVPPGRVAKIPSHFGKVPLHCIGEIARKKAINLITVEGKTLPVEPNGWDHFARTSHR